MSRIYFETKGRLVLFLGLALGLFVWFMNSPAGLLAIGCDPFGYARQARLFRKLGLFSGLDTKVVDPDSHFLIGVAKGLNPNSESWREAIAPHCHHYLDAVDAVILQYPPGTGFVLSLFPEKISLECVLIFGMALVSACFVWAVASGGRGALGSLLGLTSLTLILNSMTQGELIGSASIPVSIALIPLGVFLGIRAFPSASDPRPFLAFLVGIIFGLLFATRLPNLLLLPGLVLALAVNCRKLPWQPMAAASAATAVGFAVAGALPVLASDWINTSNPFSTTYSKFDATPPRFDFALVTDHFFYYFSKSSAAPVSITAAAFIIWRLVIFYFENRGARQFGLWMGATLTFGLSIVFFCSHELTAAYYMLPASVFVLCCVTFEWTGDVASGWSRPGRLAALALSVLPLLISAEMLRHALHRSKPQYTIPGDALAAKSIVWANISAGTIFYYQHKYAGKLVFAPPCTQESLVRKVSELGRDQYFIQDSEPMRAVIERLSKSLELQEAGEFQTYDTLPILKLPAGSAWHGASCE